jgi:isoleucyl-tRNA synthetase
MFGLIPVLCTQWHYPFDKDKIDENKDFPADFIAVSTTRGWFIHFIGTSF